MAIAALLGGFAYADDGAETARAAARSAPAQRPSQKAAPQGRGKAEPSREQKSAATTSRAAAVRKIAASSSASAPQSPRDSATRQQVVSRAAVTGKISQPASRNTGALSKTVRPVLGRGSMSRSAHAPVISSSATRATASAARNAANSGRVSRAAVTGKVVGASVSPAYNTCRETYFSCMDEFCANKDASLRRCACSSRLHDFDGDKKILEQAQVKLSDFNDRLLAVNMDKEDAEAMLKSTAGEDAYNDPDKSASQKALDEILKKIKAKTGETQQTQSLAAITFSAANMDGDMFDAVDSMLGAETAAKEGDALYRAALPTCVEMANEVCEPADVKIVQSAYQMSIEQDCNTLSKNYALLKSTALEKAKEGSALLDMSRLTNYQERNSADILACAKQMIEMVNTDAVCGGNFDKCLDWTGKYIDPSTGSAILSEDLADLGDMLTPPAANERWADIPANASMVRFLESKKLYIEPAMKNCEEISAAAWDNFMEDALAKIKIAQRKKLDDMRQSCTVLVGQCKSEQMQSIQDFDARALSIFGVLANVMVSSMCSDVQSACGALMKKIEPTTEEGSTTVGEGWGNAMHKADLERMYRTILQTCKLVGQECIKTMCQTRDQQFGLCLEDNSSQRRAILSTKNGNNCYDEVEQCVGQADYDEYLKDIVDEYDADFHVKRPGDYTSIYSDDKPKAKIGKNIWGMCEKEGVFEVDNRIVLDNETVLGWFGRGTNVPSCYTGECEDGSYIIFRNYDTKVGKWTENCNMYGSSAYEFCGADKSGMEAGGIVGGEDKSILLVGNIPAGSVLPDNFKHKGQFTNCCNSEIKDKWENCCGEGMGDYSTGINKDSLYDGINMCSFDYYVAGSNTYPELIISHTNTYNYCVPTDMGIGVGWKYIATNVWGDSTSYKHLFCLGNLRNGAYGTNDSDNDNTETCEGTFVTVDENGIYSSRLGSSGDAVERYLNYFYANTNDAPDKGGEHHKLYVYLPANFYNSNQPKEAGYYPIASSDYVKNETYGNYPRHHVAYCEEGFYIDTDNDKFGCCKNDGISTENCKTYFKK